MPAMKSVIRAGLWVLTVAFVGWLGLGDRCASALRAAEPVTLESVVKPGPNRADEALAETFSLASAHRFLDAAALSWQKERKCFSCHTSGRWYTRSLYRDNHHFITHAGTAMAVMALEACRDEEIQHGREIDHE